MELILLLLLLRIAKAFKWSVYLIFQKRKETIKESRSNKWIKMGSVAGEFAPHDH